MKIGFTGTQDGMSEKQRIKLIATVELLNAKECHHGDCIGSDEQFHKICYDRNIKIVMHPPINSKYRAFCLGNIILKEKDYLVRNKDIVNDTDILIATPKGKEILRSGTWSTIRYAKNKNRRVIIIDIDGDLK